MKSRWMACVFVLLLGCSEDGGVAGDGGTGGSGDTGGDGGAGGFVELFVTTQESQGPVPLGPALEGVEVCQTDTTNCVTTDADGEAVLMLPANQEVSYTVSKDGYAPFLAGDVTDETFTPFFTWPMFSNAQLEDNAQNRLMIAWPWEGGVIALGSGMAGVTYSLIDGTGKQWYKEEDWNVTLGLNATTSVGQGGFAEVSPGEYQVEFGGTAANCTPSLAWPGNAPNRVKVPVKDKHLTFATMECDGPSDIDKARAATERYQVLQNALDDGYEPNPAVPCMAQHGWRYANDDYFQAALVSGPDIEKPVNLVYEREENGDMTLVAVEYLASGAGDPPTIFGQEMAGPFCIPDVPALYSLHVWLWKDNPGGMFAAFNSTVPADVCIVDDVDSGVPPPSFC